MKNETNMRIPKKYEEMLSEVFMDSDGYWAYSKDGYYFEHMDCHFAHEDTQKELLAVIRTLKPCDCDECKKNLKDDAAPKVENEIKEVVEIEPYKVNTELEDAPNMFFLGKPGGGMSFHTKGINVVSQSIDDFLTDEQVELIKGDDSMTIEDCTNTLRSKGYDVKIINFKDAKPSKFNPLIADKIQKLKEKADIALKQRKYAKAYKVLAQVKKLDSLSNLEK